MSDVITPAMDLHPQPAGGAPRPWAFPAPERTTLDNGLTVLTCHRPGQQVVAVEVLLDSPLDTEPEGLDGLATIMARAFSEGTDRDSAEEFAAELERCGATLDAFADHPGVRLSLEVPVSRLEKALGLLADALRAPAFAEAEIERLVRNRLDEIPHEQANPARRAAKELSRQLFPAGASPDPARAPRRPSSGSTRPPSAPSTSGTSARPPPPPSSSATWRAPTSAPCSPEASAPGRATPGSPTRSRRSPPTTPAASSSSTGPAPSRRSCSSAASAPTGTTGSGPPRSSAHTASAAP